MSSALSIGLHLEEYLIFLKSIEKNKFQTHFLYTNFYKSNFKLMYLSIAVNIYMHSNFIHHIQFELDRYLALVMTI